MRELKTIKRTITLRGLTPILFDRYSGNNKEQLAVMEKLYIKGNVLVLPSTNILSFLSAQNTESAPQRVIGRGYKEVCKAAQSFITIEPFEIPLTRNGKPITIENGNIKIHHAVAKIMKGKLIVIDGTDGSGKATQTELLVKRLKAEKMAKINDNLKSESGILDQYARVRNIAEKFEIYKNKNNTHYDIIVRLRLDRIWWLNEIKIEDNNIIVNYIIISFIQM